MEKLWAFIGGPGEGGLTSLGILPRFANSGGWLLPDGGRRGLVIKPEERVLEAGELVLLVVPLMLPAMDSWEPALDFTLDALLWSILGRPFEGPPLLIDPFLVGWYEELDSEVDDVLLRLISALVFRRFSIFRRCNVSSSFRFSSYFGLHVQEWS